MIADLQIVFKNHTNRSLHSPWALNDKITSLEWDTALPGGFGICKLGLRWFPAWDRIIDEARIFKILHGMEQVYAGRVADPELKGDTIQLEAYGANEHAGQRRVTVSYTGTNYPHDIFKDVVLDNLPLVANNWQYVDDGDFDMGAMTWTRKTAR